MHIKLATSIFALATVLSTSAHATDVYNQRGSTKDTEPTEVTISTASRSGFYIKGDLGIAQGDRDVTRDISGEVGKTKLQGQDTETLEDDILANVPYFAGALDRLNGSDSFDGLVFGGEVSYLFVLPNRRLGLELATGVTFYGDAETTHSFDGVVNGKAHEVDHPGYVYTDGSDFPISTNLAGFTKVDRDFDIDLILRGHLFLANNLSIYAGGGLSMARASISGYATDGNVEHSFKEKDWAPGLVLNAGLQYWATDRIIVGLDYTYKKHEFDASKGSTFGDGEECDPYLSVNDKAGVNDDVHAIKARLGVKLGATSGLLE